MIIVDQQNDIYISNTRKKTGQQQFKTKTIHEVFSYQEGKRTIRYQKFFHFVRKNYKRQTLIIILKANTISEQTTP